MAARAFIAFSLCLIAFPTEVHAESPLDDAYRQEIQLLETEKRELMARMQLLEKQAKEDAAALRSEVSKISEKVTSLQLENNALEEKLSKEGEEVHVGSDREALLGNTLDQAMSTLLRQGIKVEQTDEDPRPVVSTIFQQGCWLAKRLGALRAENGSYFTPDGTEKKAELLWLSQIAAVSLDPKSGGALGPAGSDALKVIHPESLAKARALVDGGSPTLVGMYLFDPLERGDQVAHGERTLWETFLAGGFVMWPILLLAVIAVLILIERLFVLRKVHTNAGRLMRSVGDRMSRGHWKRAAEACHQEPGAVARVLGTVLRHREQPRSQIEELVNESILAERPTLERFLSALNVIAAVAPLLGLLGTVTGMISTFHVITEHGTGDPRLLSGGISEALLTTEFGLIVAIPTLLLHALLSSRVDHVLSDMETNALRLLNKMHCEHCTLLKNGGCRGAQNGEEKCPNLARNVGQPLLVDNSPMLIEEAMGGIHA